MELGGWKMKDNKNFPGFPAPFDKYNKNIQYVNVKVALFIVMAINKPDY